MLEYYFVLRSVLRTKPHLRPLLVRCQDCRIRFFTDPRNRGREDLRCPFGCRAAHARRSSRERSTAYNRTAAGKAKKKRYNANRRQRRSEPDPVEEAETAVDETAVVQAATTQESVLAAAQVEAAAVAPDQPSEVKGVDVEDVGRRLADGEFDGGMVEYLRVTTRLIEGRAVSREEVLEMLRRVVRQHSFAGERRIDYVLRYLKEHPP